MTPISELMDQISEFILNAPNDQAIQIMNSLHAWDRSNWQLSKARLIKDIHNPQTLSTLLRLIEVWERDCPDISGESLAIAMQSSLAIKEKFQHARIELVWTGPDSYTIPIRRTDQALLQLIDLAKSHLLIVSFAVYKIDSIRRAIERALERGVSVKIVLEDAESEGSKLSFSGHQAFGRTIASQARFYVWPVEKRIKTDDGRYGSLHAKVAVGDRKTLLISSANLTEYAMDLNMEMGVLIEGGDHAGKVVDLFEELIRGDILQV